MVTINEFVKMGTTKTIKESFYPLKCSSKGVNFDELHKIIEGYFPNEIDSKYVELSSSIKYLLVKYECVQKETEKFSGDIKHEQKIADITSQSIDELIKYLDTIKSNSKIISKNDFCQTMNVIATKILTLTNKSFISTEYEVDKIIAEKKANLEEASFIINSLLININNQIKNGILDFNINYDNIANDKELKMYFIREFKAKEQQTIELTNVIIEFLKFRINCFKMLIILAKNLIDEYQETNQLSDKSIKMLNELLGVINISITEDISMYLTEYYDKSSREASRRKCIFDTIKLFNMMFDGSVYYDSFDEDDLEQFFNSTYSIDFNTLKIKNKKPSVYYFGYDGMFDLLSICKELFMNDENNISKKINKQIPQRGERLIKN